MQISERTSADLESLRVISEIETADLLGVHINTLKRMRRSATGPTPTFIGNSRLGYRVVDVRNWLEQQRAPEGMTSMSEDRTPPDDQERAELAAECVDVIRALRGSDYARMNEILRGSRHPAWKHAIEALVMCAYLVNRTDDPELTLIDLLIAGERETP